MWHVLHLISRPFEALLGMFCIATAVLLYPKEDGTIQSKFEDFWVRVDDYQKLALSRHAAFMTQVAKLESQFLDLIFGHKLISVRSIGVSFAISLLSLSMACFWVSVHSEGLFSNAKEDAIFGTGILIASLIIGATSIPRRATLALRVAGFVCAVIVLEYTLKYHYFEWITTDDLPMLLYIPVLGGFICDVLFIIISRRLLGWAGEMRHPLKVVAVILCDLIVALLLLCPLLMLEELNTPLEFLSYFTSLTNLLDSFLALLFVSLTLILLVHRAAWPLLTRTLFRMTDIGTKGRRAILTTVGIALLGTSVFGGKFPELMAKLIEKLGG